LDTPGTTWPRWPRGSDPIVSWQPLPAELVQSGRLPAGRIEVRRHGQAEPDLHVLEIATYPEARVADQVVDDTALVYLDRRVLPEVVVLFLHPKGNIEAAGAVNLRSRQGWTDWRLCWRIVKLWEIPADELLAASDVGLIPWVPLTQFLSGQAVGASAGGAAKGPLLLGAAKGPLLLYSVE